MLTFRSWLQCGQAAYTIHFRHSHSQKSGAVKSGKCYGQLSCQIVNKLCWKYLQSYVVAIYVGLQNNNANMMCSYIYDLALYKISNVQQSSQSVTGTKSRPKKIVYSHQFFYILQKNYQNFRCIFSKTYYHKTETCHFHLMSMNAHHAGVTGYRKL